MSANTRRQEKLDKERVLARVAGQFSIAVDLIQKDARKPEMVEVLLRSFQLFKENKLAGAIVTHAVTDVTDPAEYFPALSQRWEDTTLSRHARKFLRERGIEYVGEIYRVKLDERSFARSTPMIREHLIGALGLPTRLDILEIRWQPPYWRDSAFRKILNIPVGRALKGIPENMEEFADSELRCSPWGLRCFTRSHSHGLHYVGSFLQTICGSGGDFYSVQQVFRNDVGVRAGMLVPPDWTAPEEVPEEWTKFQVRRDQVPRRPKVVIRVTPFSEQERKARALQRSVEELEISVRLTNCLRVADIETVRELVQMTEAEILRCRPFNLRALRELQDVLANEGLQFGITEEEITRIEQEAERPDAHEEGKN